MATVRFLRTAEGKCPLEEFLGGLSPKDAQKVLWVFRLIERLDRVPTAYLKKLAGSEEIWEVRVQGSSQIYRVFSFFNRDDLWVLHGYSKKGRRTEPREIRRAERLRRDFTARHGG